LDRQLGEYTMASVLAACAAFSNMHRGILIHRLVVKRDLIYTPPDPQYKSV